MNVFFQSITWFTGTKAWAWFTKKVLAQLDMRILGDSKFPMDKFYEIEKICSENSEKRLVFVSYGTKLSSVLIRLISRCTWTHAGMVRFDGKTKIVHMESVGLLNQTILELLKQVDSFAILEIPMTQEEMRMSDCIMDSYIEAKPGYDFQMLRGNKALYCSELVYEMIKFLPFVKMHVEAGRKVFEPDDVYKIGKVLFEHKT